MYVCVYVCVSTFFKHLLLWNHRADWNEGTKVCSNGLGHITKMAAMPIYGKNLYKYMYSSLEPKLGIRHRVLKYYKVCSNNVPGLTWPYFTARSNLVPCAFVWEKVKIMDFSETIVVYDTKGGRCSQPIWSCTKGQSHSFTLFPITQIKYF